MIDYYLAFSSESAARVVLYRDDDVANYANIDTIGLIYKPTGKIIKSAEGDYPEMAVIHGWHVNVRIVEGEDAESLKQFEVTPTTPIRILG